MDEKKKNEEIKNTNKEPKKEVKTEKKNETKAVKVESKVEPKVETKKEAPKEANKKFEQKKVEDKKTKQKNKAKPWIASVVTVAVVLIIAAILTVMIVTSSDPKKSLDGLFTNLKAGDFEKAQEFLTGEQLLEDEEFNAEEQALLFNKLGWKVKKVTKDGTNATIEVEITNKNFKAIVDNYMEKVLDAAKSLIGGGQISEEDFEQYFVEELKNEQIETVTETKTIKAVQEDKKWKIVSDDELIDNLLPGLREAISTAE